MKPAPPRGNHTIPPSWPGMPLPRPPALSPGRTPRSPGRPTPRSPHPGAAAPMRPCCFLGRPSDLRSRPILPFLCASARPRPYRLLTNPSPPHPFPYNGERKGGWWRPSAAWCRQGCRRWLSDKGASRQRCSDGAALEKRGLCRCLAFHLPAHRASRRRRLWRSPLAPRLPTRRRFLSEGIIDVTSRLMS